MKSLTTAHSRGRAIRLRSLPQWTASAGKYVESLSLSPVLSRDCCIDFIWAWRDAELKGLTSKCVFVLLLLQGTEMIWIRNWFCVTPCRNGSLCLSYFTVSIGMFVVPLLTAPLHKTCVVFQPFFSCPVFGFTRCSSCNTPCFVTVLLVEYISTFPQCFVACRFFFFWSPLDVIISELFVNGTHT